MKPGKMSVLFFLEGTPVFGALKGKEGKPIILAGGGGGGGGCPTPPPPPVPHARARALDVGLRRPSLTVANKWEPSQNQEGHGGEPNLGCPQILNGNYH